MSDDNTIETEPKRLENLNPPIAKFSLVSAANPFLGFIVSHWKLVLAAVLCVIIYVEYDMIKHYKAEAATDSTTITILTASLVTANKAMEDQNDEIRKAKKQGEDKQAELDALGKKLKAKDIADQKRIKDLMNKPEGTTCQDALNFMNSYIVGGK